MKKIYTLALLATILVIPVLTQGQRNNFSVFSLDFGLNSTLILNQNTYGNQELAYRQKLGFSCMASYRQFAGKYGYSFGLGYGNMGQDYSGEMAGTDAQRSIDLQYIQMPLMGMFNLGGNHQRTWLSFGPQLMILLTAEQDFDRKGGTTLPNPDLLYQGNSNVKNRFNPLDMMLAFEIAHQFSTGLAKTPSIKTDGKVMWSLSLNGAIGLTDINRNSYQISNLHNEYASSHNFYIGIHLGFLFNSNANNTYSHTTHTKGYGALRVSGPGRYPAHSRDSSF